MDPRRNEVQPSAAMPAARSRAHRMQATRTTTRLFGPAALVLIASALAGLSVGHATVGAFAVSAATIDAGGNHATGGAFGLEGSIAQPLAGTALGGGTYRVDSGFQALGDDAIFASGFE